MASELAIFYSAEVDSLNKFKKEYNKESLNKCASSGNSLLHYAITGNNYDVAHFLISEGIGVNIQGPRGKTALYMACETSGNMDDEALRLVDSLLLSGADIEIRDIYGNSALWVAVFHSKGRRYDIVERLMLEKPDIFTKNKAGRSPLDFAKQINDDKMVQILTKE